MGPSTNMSLLQIADLNRGLANSQLDPKVKSELGQFMTPAPICEFMASLFGKISGDISLLDAGSGVGSLIAAFVDSAKGKDITSISATAYELDPVMHPFLQKTLESCEASSDCNFQFTVKNEDFIHHSASKLDIGLFAETAEQYSHVIMNPPYKKISGSSDHRKSLSSVGIETVNLYSGFVALAIKLLQSGGELVAIIPRSFCNGPYYTSFRKYLLSEMSIQQIHIFDSRNSAFSEDKVLQENIIIHCIKGLNQQDVLVTSSPSSDFHIDQETGEITAIDMTCRKIGIEKVVIPSDPQSFIHIAVSDRDQAIVDRLSVFNTSLESLGVSVSTGPVVNFRLRGDLRIIPEDGSVPLLFPQHLNGGINWPLKGEKKPNSIMVSRQSTPYLWKNEGFFLITKRFTSKEEKRRVVATLYDSSLPGDLVGFENKTNVFHHKKVGLEANLAKGLFLYLNCTLLDKYYRQFSGHTQINATDLKSIYYPNKSTLRQMGAKVHTLDMSQADIDDFIDKEIDLMTSTNEISPLRSQGKINEAIEILKDLGMPKGQLNERSALTFLALLNLHPNGDWQTLESPMLGVTPIMDWCSLVYGKNYAPNTRETFRRQTLHQFTDGGVSLYNPDAPDRPVNSPKACYQIVPELFAILPTYGTAAWSPSLADFLSNLETLTSQYAMEREMAMVPLTLDDGTEIKLSAGIHSELIRDIVTDFGPRFAPGAEVIYLGDTGAKEDFFRKDRLAELGVTVNRKGKLPDVVLYWEARNWLLLIESVTSHGPVDGKRYGELSLLFGKSAPGLVYVSAFPDRQTMTKYLTEISWETEVWLADAPTHMIHFNGDRFLGPHANPT